MVTERKELLAAGDFFISTFEREKKNQVQSEFNRIHKLISQFLLPSWIYSYNLINPIQTHANEITCDSYQPDRAASAADLQLLLNDVHGEWKLWKNRWQKERVTHRI